MVVAIIVVVENVIDAIATVVIAFVVVATGVVVILLVTIVATITVGVVNGAVVLVVVESSQFFPLSIASVSPVPAGVVTKTEGCRAWVWWVV